MAMDGLKKTLAVSSFALASTLGPMAPKPDASQEAKVEAVQKFREVASSRIINQTGESILTNIFQGD